AWRRRLEFANAHCLYPSADRAAEGLDPVTLCEFDHRALRVLALTEAGTGPLALSLAVKRVHRQHADVEDLLDRDLDLRLVRVRVNQERVPVVVELAIALLGNDRRENDVARIRDRAHLSVSLLPATPRNSSRASVVKTTSSATSTSYVFNWPASIRCT